MKKRFTQQYGDEEGRCPSELSLQGTDTIPEVSVVNATVLLFVVYIGNDRKRVCVCVARAPICECVCVCVCVCACVHAECFQRGSFKFMTYF